METTLYSTFLDDKEIACRIYEMLANDILGKEQLEKIKLRYDDMYRGLMFCILEKNLPEKVLGVFEITPHKTNTVSGEKCNYEICYFLHKEARGKGYMTEVVKRMKRYLFDERMADSLTIAVLLRNDASRRVALKSGFTYEGLEKKCGMNYLDEVVDLEYYTLYKEEYLNPDEKIRKEKQTIASKQKWINDGGILYPIPGYASLLTSPGNGIFRIYEQPQTKRLGLEKIDDTFRFDFKIYDLDCEDIMSKIIKTWTSDLFRESNKNLGVIFNGIKGTGKTIAAKQLCNRIGLPVIVISKPVDGMLEFIQSLHFESIILIDEAEKTFREEQEVLLKMIDGVYNDMRKLYILTTNKLSIDENLLGRPGRIRYIKEFSNLSAKAVNDVIDDNLNDISLKDDVLKVVDSLEISTIDILKAIIDECNIMGSVPSDSTLNIPKAKYKIQIISFDNLELKFHRELQDYIINHLAADESVINWLQKVIGTDGKGKKFKKNLDLIEEMYDCRVCIEWRPTSTLGVYIGKHLGCGIVNSKPDGYGFFTREADWDNSTELCCLCNDYNIPSLYRGNL